MFHTVLSLCFIFIILQVLNRARASCALYLSRHQTNKKSPFCALACSLAFIFPFFVMSMMSTDCVRAYFFTPLDLVNIRDGATNMSFRRVSSQYSRRKRRHSSINWTELLLQPESKSDVPRFIYRHTGCISVKLD